MQKDKASGRKAVASKAVESVGGKLESFYCALGANEVVIIVDLPDKCQRRGVVGDRFSRRANPE